MARIVKDPGVRRNELIDAAEKLFSEKGYDETAVSDIVKKANVAQGLFYYYFRSKDELLDALVEKMVNEVSERVDKVVLLEGAGALDRFSAYFQVFRTIGKGREKLIEYIHEERNAHIHLKIEKRIYPRITPPLAEIIRQGIGEGIFKTDHPQEAALSILVISNALSEGRHDHTDKVEIKIEEILPLLDLMERILGAEPGTFMEYLRGRTGR